MDFSLCALLLVVLVPTFIHFGIVIMFELESSVNFLVCPYQRILKFTEPQGVLFELAKDNARWKLEDGRNF
jgi:hypothetical protein